VDALSDVLAAIRLDGAVYIKAEFKAPWCVETQYGLHTAAYGGDPPAARGPHRILPSSH